MNVCVDSVITVYVRYGMSFVNIFIIFKSIITRGNLNSVHIDLGVLLSN